MRFALYDIDRCQPSIQPEFKPSVEPEVDLDSQCNRDRCLAIFHGRPESELPDRRDGLLGEWVTETISGVNSSKKFMYVFENELGVGYIKQLRVDGSGFTTTLFCTANFDPDRVRFQLDPDFVDHVLIGEDDFQYNEEYLNKKAFRDDAVKKNTKMLVRTQSTAKRVEWLAKLKVGDVFWAGWSLDVMIKNCYTVVRSVNDQHPLSIEATCNGRRLSLEENWFSRNKVCDKQPHPLEDPLCGHPK